MSKKHRELTLEELADAQKRGLDNILDNVEVTGTAVIMDKHGRVRSKLKLGNVKFNKGKQQ